MKQEWKKYLIGAIIVAIIILLIIWYRNNQKKKAAELAKANLISKNEIIPVSSKTDVGKTAFVKVTGTKFYNVGNFTVAYIKNNIGEFAGTVAATQTDSGSDSFYKVTNTSGQSLYVLKSQVTVK